MVSSIVGQVLHPWQRGACQSGDELRGDPLCAAENRRSTAPGQSPADRLAEELCIVGSYVVEIYYYMGNEH